MNAKQALKSRVIHMVKSTPVRVVEKYSTCVERKVITTQETDGNLHLMRQNIDPCRKT